MAVDCIVTTGYEGMEIRKGAIWDYWDTAIVTPFLSLCRCGFCYMEADHVPAGIYNVIPTTFLPKQEGPFFLDFSSTMPLKVSQLQ